MPQRLCSLDDQCCTFVGRARTARRIDVDYYHPENPYGKEIEFMDSLKENDVVVHSTDYTGTNAPWGELMSTTARVRKAVGCMCDSQICVCVKIKKLEFPVFYVGTRPLDSSGRGVGGRL